MLAWDDLRHFAALAEEGTLTRAARRLGVEHATVARRIAALEAAAGARLVDRRSGRYLLTPTGERVAAHARRIGAEALALERTLLGDREDLDAEVSVTAAPLLLARVVAPRLPGFLAAHPRLRLRLVAEARNLSLPRREADLALRLSRPEDMSLIARRVGAIEYGLYAAPGYAAGRDPADWRFVGFDDSLGSAPHQLWLEAQAGDRPIVLRSNDLQVQWAAARAGVGVIGLPVFAAEGLVRLQPGTALLRDLWLAYHRDLRGSLAIGTVGDFLATCVRTLAD